MIMNLNVKEITPNTLQIKLLEISQVDQLKPETSAVYRK